jgi:hypothetical protein
MGLFQNRGRTVLVVAAVTVAAGGAYYYWWSATDRWVAPPNSSLPFERLTNTFFTPDTATAADALVAPEVRHVRMPDVPGNSFVWGATGRDETGNVWIGVSVDGGPHPSAHLVEYDPTADVAMDRGNVLDELDRLGLMQPGEAQVKIHSRIVQAGDGHLYFATMNDTHEEGGPRAPPFGSHLWRFRLPERRWEHLLAAPEGLIAVAGGGDFIYALGYPDHRLVQYHVPTSTARWITVGSQAGHISRNFIADARGHVFVPRLRPGPAESMATLVEFDTDLRELDATPMPHYLAGAPVEAHGIVAFQHLPDRSVYFATDIGRLYRIDTDFGSGPGLVTDAGWFNPQGTAYTPSLFTTSGTTTLVGLGHNLHGGADRSSWLTYDLRLKLSFAVPFHLPEIGGKPLRDVLLYGSQTRDRYGDFYVVGSHSDGRARPLVLRIRSSRAAGGAELPQSAPKSPH